MVPNRRTPGRRGTLGRSRSSSRPAPYSFTATSASPAVFTAVGNSYANGTPVVLTGSSLPGGFAGAPAAFTWPPSRTHSTSPVVDFAVFAEADPLAREEPSALVLQHLERPVVYGTAIVAVALRRIRTRPPGTMPRRAHHRAQDGRNPVHRPYGARPAAPRPRHYCQACHGKDRSEQLPCRQRHSHYESVR